MPKRVDPERPIFVTVHGVSRNAREQIDAFASHAETEGLVVLAPYFDKRIYPDFQRLGREGRGFRADRALDHVLASLRRREGVVSRRVLFFGYSGGGQFVHRYLMAHPEAVEAAVVAAAGWYTFPNRRRYPRGTRIDGALDSVSLHPRRFLRVPVLVAVGEHDTARDANLRCSPYLDRVQGRDRVERAERWVSAMVRAAERKAVASRVDLRIIPGAGHSFAEAHAAGLGDITMDFFRRSVELRGARQRRDRGERRAQ